MCGKTKKYVHTVLYRCFYFEQSCPILRVQFQFAKIVLSSSYNSKKIGCCVKVTMRDNKRSDICIYALRGAIHIHRAKRLN